MTGYLASVFSETFRARPRAPAVVSGSEELSYDELSRLANSYAVRLAAAGVAGGDRVGLEGRSSPHLLAGVIAVSMLGCSVVPAPGVADGGEEQRLRDLGVRWVVAFRSDLSLRKLSGGADLADNHQRGGEAYVLATSGSTSVPKNVPISDANLDAFTRLLTQHPHTPAGGRLALNYSSHFDPFFGILLAAWMAEGAIVLPRSRENILADRFVNKNEVDAWDSVPSHLVAAHRLGRMEPGSLARLKVVVIGGELLPVALMHAIRGAAPNAEIVNAYGPTETTITASEWRWMPEAGHEALADGVPIGTIVPGLEHMILATASDGEGELCLRGPQRFSGYSRAGDNEGRFVFVDSEADGPLHSSNVVASDAWYRTGDLVRSGPHGLQFLGRVDQVVKVAGQRVDLAFVEDQIRTLPCVDAVWTGAISGHLYGVVQHSSRCDEVLHDVSFSSLRAYAVPRKILWVRTLPLLRNGKLDLRAIERLVRREIGTS